MKRTIYVFDGFQLDPVSEELLANGQRIDVGPKPLRVLTELVRNCHRIVSRELLKGVWSGDPIEDPENVLTRTITSLRKALNDDPVSPKYIKTVKGQGYRFLKDVTERPASESLSTGTGGRSSGQHKVLYAKIIHLCGRDASRPVYRCQPYGDDRAVEVFDEVMYYSLHSFDEEQPSWEWSIVSSGSPPITHITHPWQPEPEYLDPQLATLPTTHINPKCSLPSKVYLTVTTMYNGIQRGREEVYAKIESPAQHVRIIVDFASLPDPKPVFKARPAGIIEMPFQGTQRREGASIQVEEPYPWVFTIASDNLKRGQILKIVWMIDWTSLSSG